MLWTRDRIGWRWIVHNNVVVSYGAARERLIKSGKRFMFHSCCVYVSLGKSLHFTTLIVK